MTSYRLFLTASAEEELQGLAAKVITAKTVDVTRIAHRRDVYE